ncbi:MAG: family 20 glycosylhydrolase [Lentisphaeria bacterium]|nr:family 20 glycosylhydrolase [Lentisphaeria bacterium]
MNRIPFLLALVWASLCAGADIRHVLFDFESGIEGWWGNPWGGGTCEVAASAEAKYGSGALRCTYRDVEKGANAVGPDLAADAPWRAQPWGGFSLWLRGDGSPAKLHIAIETTQDRSPDQPGGATFSVDVPLKDASWHRLEFSFSRLWNREKLRLDPARIRRFIFGATGSHDILLDQIGLEAPGRDCWAETRTQGPREGPGRLLSPPAWTQVGTEHLAVSLDLTPLRPEHDVLVAVACRLAEGVLEHRVTLTPGAVRTAEWSHGFSLSLTADEPALATVLIESPPGTRVASWEQSFVVHGPDPEAVVPPLPIYPVPKRIRRDEGVFRFAAVTRVRTEGVEARDVERTVGLFGREMASYYGRRVALSADGPAEMLCAVAPGTLDGGPERYELDVTPAQIRVRAQGPEGLYYALQSLLAAVDAETRSPREAVAPCLSITDWPSFPFRGVSVSNPTNRWGHPNDAGYPVEDFCDFLYRTVARQKLNKVVFIVPEGMRFESHPELASPNAWSKNELRRLVAFAEEHYIELIPLVTVLGHANWFTIKHPELIEPGNQHNIACVRMPETNRLIADVIAEVIEVFRPRTFHLGMDECWWRTLDKPPEERCPRCGEDWPDIVAGQATFFHDLLARQGIRAMMWGDMLLPEHNGGAPYHTARALPRIPRDMIVTNWSAGLAPDSSKRFRDAGLTVVRANSQGVPRAEAPYVIGNMMGLWSKVPWLTDTYHKTAAVYSYLAIPQAAEFSWNVDPSPGARGMQRDMLRERADSVLRRMALRSSPHAGAEQTPIPLARAVNEKVEGLGALPLGALHAARIRFETLDRVVFAEEVPTQIPVAARAAEVNVLVGCHLPAEAYDAFTERFRRKESMGGVDVGSVVFTYADGTSESLPLLYGASVLPWDRDLAPPYLYGAVGSVSVPGDAPEASVYVVQWVNPRPEETIVSMSLRTSGTEARPFLLAATRR